MELAKMILNKLMSARFLLVVGFGITLCWMAWGEPSVRDAFFALAGGVIRDYFGKNRPEENGVAKQP